MKSYLVFLLAIVTGLLYALSTRLIFGLHIDWPGRDFTSGAMLVSFAFIFVMPFAAGYITAYVAKPGTSLVYCLLAPWITVVLLLFFSFIFALEGLICIVMVLPVFLLMGSFGGLTAYFVGRAGKNINTVVLCSVVLLPFLTIPVENNIESEKEFVAVQTSIMINSTDDKVWDNIVRVYEIDEKENESTFFLFMGFPRPIKAELDKEGIGGVRIAEFDRGLYFTETVTEWDPKKSFTFTIDADPNSIPLSALDEHVTVGSKYFDVLEGKYELEPVEGGVVLHLTSKFVMSTSFNFYSKIWCKAIMKDIQDNILHVIKRRCEGTTNNSSSYNHK
ncbi:MAG: hypothetical protein KDC42_05505 [Ignavibacteriae bacterium]|nr:hypothetical protein [Ignavibacteriota bacterium]